MIGWKENVHVLDGRRMEDVPAILEELISITSAISEVRKTESSAYLLALAKRIVLLGKHPSAEVKKQAMDCLKRCFSGEFDAIREEIAQKKLVRNTS